MVREEKKMNIFHLKNHDVDFGFFGLGELIDQPKKGE